MFGDGHRPPASARTTSRSPSRRPRSTSSCFVCRAPRWRPSPAGPASPEGWIEWGGCGWSTRACWSPAVSTRRPTPASRSAWASSGRCMFRHNAEDMRDTVRRRRAVHPLAVRNGGSEMRVPLSWSAGVRRRCPAVVTPRRDRRPAHRRSASSSRDRPARRRPHRAAGGRSGARLEPEPQKNGKTITGARSTSGTPPPGEPQDRLRRPQLRRRRPGRGRAARRECCPGVRDRRTQDLRARVRRA